MSQTNNAAAVLGTGIMGAAMARNLAAAGMEVRAWNRSREKAEPLAETGITIADSPAEATRGARYAITMLADAAAIESTLQGGALGELAPAGLWIQMSTIGIPGNDRMAQLAREAGVSYVDAPVLGTKAPAEQGALVVLASGPDEAQSSCEPVFDAVGQRTIWLGAAGGGSRLKLVVNNWITGLLGTLAETVALARATGVDPEQFLGAIEGGPLDIPYAHMKGKMMISEDFPTSFSARLARKDIGLAVEAAGAEELHLYLAETVAERFDAAIREGYGEADMAAVYKGYR